MTHYAALAHNPATFGAGQPWGDLRPYRKTLGSQIVEPSPEWLAIIDGICVRHQLHRKDVLGGWRSVGAVACRDEVWATLRERFGTSYPKIGMMTGGFHHTAVMDGIARYCRAQKKANSHTSQGGLQRDDV